MQFRPTRHSSFRPAPQAGPTLTPFDGILLVDKPAGFTSSDIVNIVRGRLRLRHVGHGGTLDPGATGLLVLLLGHATALSDRVMGGEKVYEGTLRLGASTNTQDSDGEVTETGDPSGITEERLRETLAAFRGDQYQTPPMVSAVKINGVPLYKLARRGEEVERKPRFIHVHDFDIVSFGVPDTRVRVRCSKGTYIRTLCHDVGERLGCHAHLHGLRRLRSGKFEVTDALPGELLKTLPAEEIAARIVPYMKAVQTL